MKLSVEQIDFYKENGYLLIENYFDGDEVKLLSAELPNTIEKNSPRIILEGNGSVRSIFAPHFVSEVYRNLANLDRLVIPAGQLIGNKVYVHQYKVNTKKGLKGDWWEWHQDFPYWHIDDGIKDPEMVSVMLYLQDTDYLNGALLLIPRTHKLGIVKFAEKVTQNEEDNYQSSLSSNIKFTVDHELIRQLAIENGIVTASGKKGSVLFFHSNIFHASNNNLTPFDRDAVLITYNSIDNLPCNGQSPRPEFLAGRNYDPIDDLAHSALK